VLEFARAVRAELTEGAKLGVCGFCWGGYPSTALCAESAVSGSEEQLIDAQFCAHPSALETPAAIVDAVSKFKVPYSLAAAEKDHRLSMKKVDEVEAALRARVGAGEGENVYHYEIVRYGGCGHGFAVRAGPENEVEMEGAGKACEQAVRWFKKWL
jgi:dienelactone hydrolase